MEASEQEIQHFRNVASFIYENKPDRKGQLNAGAKQVLAAISHEFPELDDKTIASFLASVAWMISQFLHTPTRDIVDILEATFDHHMLAVASLVGSIDLNDGDDSGPTVEELIKEQKTEMPERTDDDTNTGMFL